MPMLDVSAAELASIQADTVAAVCDKPCVVQRKTVTKDLMGTGAETRATIATTVAGMTQPTGGQLSNYAYKIGNLATWLIRLPVGTDVMEQDYLEIAEQTLVVQVLLDPHSYPALLPVLASEVK